MEQKCPHEAALSFAAELDRRAVATLDRQRTEHAERRTRLRLHSGRVYGDGAAAKAFIDAWRSAEPEGAAWVRGPVGMVRAVNAEASRPTARLFVAAWLPEAVVDQLAALARPAEPGVRWIPPNNWHVTLRFLGSADPLVVAARLGDAQLPTATAVVGPAVARLGRSALVVPVAGLEALADAVVGATDDVGRPPERRAFDGHVTLARLRGGSRSTTQGAPVTASFPVEEVALVKSVTRSEGAVYETLGRWATRPP